MKQIIEAIKTVGFPIVMCLLLLYVVFVSLDKIQMSMDANTQAVSKLTLVIEQKLVNSYGSK